MRRWLKVTLIAAVLGIPAVAYAGTQLTGGCPCSDCPCPDCPCG
ncbi:hypothetical protein WME79_13280 [Sorangium sp. So ce726]